MTNVEAFSLFEKEYSYDYLAQPDLGERTVIFSFYPKNQYRTKPRSEWIPEIKFEAESLEKAFLYAFMKCGYQMLGEYDFGTIFPFDKEQWEKQVFATEFWSLQDKCWKTVVPCEENVVIKRKIGLVYEKAN